MFRSFKLAIAALLAMSSSALAQFSGFTAVPTHPTPGIQLNWTGPDGSITVNRWVDGHFPMPIVVLSGSSYTDTSADVNTLYYYSLTQAGNTSATVQAVVSDLTKPFVCPFVQPVPASAIGVDHVVAYTTANGTPVSFTINAPRTTSTVTIPPCNGADGCDDRTNINAAIANGVKIQLLVGLYVLNIPNAATPFGINYNLFSDVAIVGVSSGLSNLAPTPATDTVIQVNLPPNGVSPYPLAIPGGTRIMIQNTIWVANYVNAIPGTVTTSGGNQRLTITNNPTWYVPNPASPPVMYSSTGYRLSNNTYDIETGGRPGIPGTFNTNFAMDGLYYYTFTGINFPNPQGAIGWVNYNATAPTIPREAVHLADTNHVTIAGNQFYGFAGGGIQMVDIGATDGGYMWVVNNRIGKKPTSLLQPGEPAAVAALFGDSDVNGTTGRIDIQGNDIGFIDDDTFAFQGGFAHQAASVVSTSQLTFTAVINHPMNVNDVFNFYDPQTLALIGSASAGSWTQIAGTLTLNITPPIPALSRYIGLSAPATPFATEPLYGNPYIYVHDNCFHDTYGHLAMLSASHGLVENNVYGNGAPQSIVMSWYPPGQPTVGVQDMLIEGNRVVGSAYGQLDTNWLGNSTFGLETGAPSFGIGFNAVAYPVSPSTTSLVPVAASGSGFVSYGTQSLQITNNFISNVPGLCVLVSGATNVAVLGNICVDANSVAYTVNYNALYCGPTSVGIPIVTTNICQQYISAQQALLLTHLSALDSTSNPNVCLGTSISCVFVDGTVTSNYLFTLFH